MTDTTIIVDLARRVVVTPAGRGIPLSWGEFSLLAELVEAQGEVRTRDDLFEAVFRRPRRPGDRHLDQTVHQVRRKLPRDADGSPMIRSVRGVGYWMRPVEQQDLRSDRWVAA